MKMHMRTCFSLSILLSCVVSYAVDPASSVTPKLTIRSQGTNAVRRVVGSNGHTHVFDREDMNGTLSAVAEYTHSFDEKSIAHSLFGDSLCAGKFLKVQGSNVVGRDENALLADYFYLPTDYNSTVEIRPKIQNFVVDLNAYFGLDHWATGLYAWIQAPIVWSKWDLGFCESITSAGVNDHKEGYFSVNTLPRESLLGSFESFIGGNAPTGGNMVGGVLTEVANSGSTGGEAPVATTATFVTRFNPLGCSRICGKSQTKTRLAEFRAALGWNFLLEEDYTLGLNIQAVAPTGSNSKSSLLFDPQVGNDHHWELGAGLNGKYTFWRSEDEEQMMSINLDATITHMFSNNQTRCFDLCGKPLSRYMLAEKLGTPVVNSLTGSPTETISPLSTLALNATRTAATSQFKAEFAPVANVTSLDVDVSVAVNADLVIWANYASGPWNFDFGYNLWARTCEKIRVGSDCDSDCNTSSFAENTWALKGDSNVYGYFGDNDGSGLSLQNDPVALSATMSKATINGGDNFGKAGFVSQVALNNGFTNPGIDNPQFAYAGINTVRLDIDRVNANQTRTSIQPVFIKQDDINFAKTKGISHKLFAHLSYSWQDQDKWVPYLGIGADVEFGSRHHFSDCNSCEEVEESCSVSCDDDCDDNKIHGDCLRSALSQWGVWAKFGISFE